MVVFTAAAFAATIIDVKDHGASPNKSPAENTAVIQGCINSMQAGQTLLINERYRMLGLCIDNKDNIRISGKGCLILSGTNASAFIFELRHNIHDIQIDSLELIGENENGIAFIGNGQDRDIYLKDQYGTRPNMSAAELEKRLRIITSNRIGEKSVYHQAAIGSYSGQSISNAVFNNLFIHDINVGISLNADLGGEYSDVQVVSNKISNLPGAAPGQGYGIHLAGTKNCIIKDNTIANASRHAIYHAKSQNGVDSKTLIQGNTILNHRKSVALSRAPSSGGWIRAAMDIARSRSVMVESNTFNACYDTCLYISRDSIQGYSCSNVTVINNHFSARQNDSPYINIGEQFASSNYFTEGVVVASNTFKASCLGYDVQILQGRNINFSYNTFSRTGVSGNLRFIRLGCEAYVSAPSDIDHVTFVGNRYSGPPNISDAIVYFIDPKVAAGSSVINISKNSLKFIPRLWRCSDDKAIVNPNFVLKP